MQRSPSTASSKSPAPRWSILVLLTGLSVLSLNMFLPSLERIADDLQSDYAVISLSISGYLAVTAVLQLLIGPLSDRFGRRPVLLAAVATFILASVGCVLATDIWAFLVFRVFQGAMIAGWVLSIAMIRDTSSEREAASRIGYISMAMAVAPMLGPSLGGVLEELFGWRSNFLAYASFGLLALVLCGFGLRETHTARAQNFSVQLQSYPGLLRSPRYWGYALCVVFSTAAFYAFLTGVPRVAGVELSMSPSVIGICMGTITAGFLVGSLLSGRYAGRHRLTTMMIAGRTVACAGLICGLTVVLSGHLSPVILFGTTVFVGLGNGLTTPSANAGALSVQPKLAGSAAGLVGALTVGCGSIITFVTGMLMKFGGGAYGLLGVMLFCSLVALTAALWVRQIERRR